MSKRNRPVSKAGDRHIVPAFGREHEESSACWCEPRIHHTFPKEKVRTWGHREEPRRR